MIPLGPYLPDAPAAGAHSTVASNCVPGVGYYAPFYSAVRYSNAAAEKVLSAASFISSAGTPYNFAGTKSYLLKITSAAWEDVSILAGYTTTGFWDWCVYGNRVIATNGEKKPQSYVMGSSTDFADLTADDVIAKTCAVVKDFVFMGYTTESAVGYPYRVRWSALGDPTDFTASVTTQSDYQDLQGESYTGKVQKVIGGEYATVFCEQGIFRGTYIGGELIFSFDQIVNGQGTPAPMSVVAHGEMIFFLGNDGFYMLTPGGLIPIGEGQVNRTFLNEVYRVELSTVQAVIDPGRSLYIVAYPVATGTLGKLIIYNWNAKIWTTAEPGNLDAVYHFYSESTATDSATAYDNIDTGAYSGTPTDSNTFVGGVASLAGVDSSHYSVVFNGSPLTATFETGEAQLTNGKTLVTNIIPAIEGSASTIYASVGYRNTPQEAVYYTSEVAANSEGECNLFNVARYQRARLRVVGGFTKAYGVTPEFKAAGRY